MALPQHRYPLAPALAALGTRSLGALAVAVDMPRRTVDRWAAEGGVTDQSADIVATRLGTWPGLLWPEWSDWESAAARKERRRLERREAEEMARGPT